GAWRSQGEDGFSGIAELQLGFLALGEAAVAKLELGGPRGKMAFLESLSSSSAFLPSAKPLLPSWSLAVPGGRWLFWNR
ncbi:hypothetical protein K3217_30375, partial [bacterium BD-1]|nr:hypothetical protein [Ottowia caeni]